MTALSPVTTLDRPAAPGVVAALVGLAAFSVVGPGLLLAAGTAPVLAAAALMLLVTAPAVSEARQLAPTPVQRAARPHLVALALGAALGAVPHLPGALAAGPLSAATTTAAPEIGPVPALVWLVVALVARLTPSPGRRRAPRWVAPGLAAVLVVEPLFRLADLAALGALDPWTALLPAWDRVDVWLPGGALLALLLPLDTLAVPAARGRPSRRLLPVASVGLALLLLVPQLVGLASALDAHPRLGVLGAARGAAVAMAVPAALGALGAALGRERPGRTLGAIAAWAAWFSWVGLPAIQWALWLVLPLAAGLWLADAAWRLQGLPRTRAGLSAVLAALVLVVGHPGLPSTLSGAFGASLTAVLALWIVGVAGVRAQLEVA